MFPILIKLGPLTIHTYGFMMAVGVAFGLWFLFVQAKKQNLPVPRIIDAAFYILLISLAGAKLVLFISNFSYYMKYPKELFWMARTGGVFQGGLAFGVIFALWYFRKHRIPTWKVADLIAPALALGHGFGRIGCFSAGCCYGRECAVPWGVTFHNEYANNLTGIPQATALHPVQLYEAGLNFLNFLILFLVLRKKTFDGKVFSLYIINYSLIRFFTEFYRGDHPDKAYLIQGSSPFFSLSVPQFFCILGLFIGIFLWMVLKKQHSG
ncbi:MAG: prolipoprotein diacylglyceryl transferase [Candidatus Aminicenantales bacterium]